VLYYLAGIDVSELYAQSLTDVAMPGVGIKNTRLHPLTG